MRPSSLKFTLLILAVAVVASGQALEPMTARVAPVNAGAAIDDDPVTTTRDAQGIWFIEGGSLYDVFEAMGYAVAQDRLWQMDLFRRQGRGTLSALLGADLVGTDVFLRTIGYSEEELTQLFEELSPEAQTVVQGYTAGINRRIGEFLIGHDWMQMPYEYWLLGLQSVLTGPGLPVLPQPFTINDTIAWTAMMQRNFDGEALATGQLENAVLAQTLGAVYGQEGLAMFADQRWINDPSALTMIPIAAKTGESAVIGMPKVDLKTFPDLQEAASNIRSRIETLHNKMEDLNARVKLGSYAWAVSGDKTASGNPIVYSGPQMGFSTPSVIAEGSVRGGGLEISGMIVPGIPLFPVARTPHHVWSMQTGHAATLDYFFEPLQAVQFHRMETIKVFGSDDVMLPIFRTSHGPVVEPMPFIPDLVGPETPIFSWAYAHWGLEAKSIEAFMQMSKAESMAEFDAGVEQMASSFHLTYADLDGNIAYWMSGYDPIRAAGSNPLLPQIGDGNHEWTGDRRPRVHDSNPSRGYYGGWNNKASIDYNNGPNRNYFGPAHRAQVVEDYLSTHDDLTYEQVRDLALNIATTDSFQGGGNTWAFVAGVFTAAVAANPSAERDAAIEMLEAWDGHFVAGGPDEWRFGTLRADAWVLQDAWIKEVMRLTFEDEFETAHLSYADQPMNINFNVLLHALAGPDASLPTIYDWFQDKSGSGKPTTAEDIIVLALDNVLTTIGPGDYNVPRGYIPYIHQIYGEMWRTPYSSRSTYAHCVEFDMNGPLRIESMFPLGESGETLPDQYGKLWINPHFFSMIPAFDPFMPRPFPTFE